jgi:hypothetical protein
MTSRQPYRRISMTLPIPIARRNIDTKSGEETVDDTPPPGLPSEESTAEIISDEFKCPICMNLYLKPTMFACGHTFCLTCHYKLDQAENGPTFTLPTFKCPLCRHSTITPWNDRPANIALDKACKHMYPKEYKSLLTLERKCKELTIKIMEQEEPHDDDDDIKKMDQFSKVNLSQLSSESQRILAERVYRKIMPLFFKVARQGKSHITISDASLVSEIEICIQPLKKKLFENNNVYKITCTPDACSVHFSKCSIGWRREYHNEGHINYPADGSEPHPSSPSTPPMPVVRRSRGRGIIRRDLRGESAIDRIIMNDLRSLVRTQIGSSDV